MAALPRATHFLIHSRRLVLLLLLLLLLLDCLVLFVIESATVARTRKQGQWEREVSAAAMATESQRLCARPQQRASSCSLSLSLLCLLVLSTDLPLLSLHPLQLLFAFAHALIRLRDDRIGLRMAASAGRLSRLSVGWLSRCACLCRHLTAIGVLQVSHGGSVLTVVGRARMG